MRRILVTMACLTFVIGLVSYVSASKKVAQNQKKWPRRKVCVVFLDSQVNASGEETFTQMRWHYTDTAHPTQYKIVTKLIGKDRTVTWDHDQSGLFAEQEGGSKLKITEEDGSKLSETELKEIEATAKWNTAEYYLTSPQYTRTDTVAGFTVYVLRVDGQGGAWLESAYSPEVGPISLRTIEHRADGTENREVAQNVEFK